MRIKYTYVFIFKQLMLALKLGPNEEWGCFSRRVLEMDQRVEKLF